MSYKDFKQIYEEVNGVSQFKGSTDKIINDAVKELEYIKNVYKESVQGEEIKKVIQKANKKIEDNRGKFMELLSKELNKNSALIPDALSPGTYGQIAYDLLKYDFMSMTDQEILEYAHSNSTDSVVVRLAKGVLCERANRMEDKEAGADLRLNARMLKIRTKDSIIQEQLNMFNTLDMNALYPGEGVGRSASIVQQGGLEAIILQKAGVEKLERVKHKGVNEDFNKEEVKQDQFR